MKPQILPKAAAGLCALLLAGGAGLAVSQAARTPRCRRTAPPSRAACVAARAAA